MDRVDFYDLRTRAHVSIDKADVTRSTITRETKTGSQTRYQFHALDEDGHKLTKFVSKATYDALAP